MSLVVLALSPLTAPFSTVDLCHLLDEKCHGGEAILQVKSAPDHSPAEATGSQGAAAPLTSVRAASGGVPATTGARGTHPIPLRI